MSLTESPDPAAPRRRLRPPFAAARCRVSWRELAACRTADPELFFPIGKTGPAIEEIQRAKAVCASCPVRLECLNYAVARPEKYGTWGGLNEDERSAERRRRMRRANAA